MLSLGHERQPGCNALLRKAPLGTDGIGPALWQGVILILRFGILTLSDRSASGERSDISGTILANLIQEQGWTIAEQTVLSDDLGLISAKIIEWVDRSHVDVILTTGGTGFSSRDVTPEATLATIEREAPGISEAIRAVSLTKTPHAMLSRARAGIRGKTLIINLPGSPKGVTESMEVLLPVLDHAIQILRGDPSAESSH